MTNGELTTVLPRQFGAWSQTGKEVQKQHQHFAGLQKKEPLTSGAGGRIIVTHSTTWNVIAIQGKHDEEHKCVGPVVVGCQYCLREPGSTLVKICYSLPLMLFHWKDSCITVTLFFFFWQIQNLPECVLGHDLDFPVLDTADPREVTDHFISYTPTWDPGMDGPILPGFSMLTLLH